MSRRTASCALKYLAENPHNGQAHAFLGRCLAQQKKLKEAVAECEEGESRVGRDIRAYAHHMRLPDL